MIIFYAVLIYVLLIVQTLFFISRYKQRFEVTLPVCILIDVLIILLAGLIFHRLTIGVIIVAILSLSSLIYTVVVERKQYRQFISQLTTPGFYAFGALYVLSWLVHFNRRVFDVDSFGAYALMTKQMFIHDVFYTHPDIHISVGKGGMHVISIFEFMFLRIMGTYNEGVMFVARSVMMISFMLPLTKMFNCRFKNLLATSTLFVSYIAISITAGSARFGVSWDEINLRYITDFGTDSVLGVLFFICLFICIFEKTSYIKLAFFSIVGICLTLTKDTGFTMSLICMTIFIIVAIMDMKVKTFQFKIKNINLLKLSLYIIVWLAPILSLLAWNYHTREIDNLMRSESLPSLSYLLNSVIQRTNGRILLRLTWWFTTPATDGPLLLTPIAFSVLFIAICLFCAKKISNDKFRSRIAIITIVIFMGFYVYSFGLIAIHSYLNFTDVAFLRYLSSYSTAMVLIICSVVIYTLAQEHFIKHSHNILVAVIAILLILSPGRALHQIFIPNTGPTNSFHYNETNRANGVFRYLAEQNLYDQRVFVLSAGNWGRMVRTYFLTSRYITGFNYVPIGGYRIDLARLPSPYEFANVLINGEFSYVSIWIGHRDEWGFLTSPEFSTLFDIEAYEIPNNHFFKVVTVDDGEYPILLRPVQLE